MINTNDRIQSSSMWESGTGGRQNKNCDRLGGLGVAWVTRGRGLWECVNVESSASRVVGFWGGLLSSAYNGEIL